jgi:hypothetical protein
MDQFSPSDGRGTLYRRRRRLRVLGVRLGPRRQVLYAAATIFVSFFVNFVFLWPVNHFWALMLFAVAISSVLVSDVRRRSAIIGSVSVFVAALVIYALVGPAVPAAPAALDWIVPMNAATPANICDAQFKGKLAADTKLVLVGDHGVLVHAGRNTPLLTVGDCKSAALYQTSAGVLLNADDYDDYGALIFRIMNNQLRLVDGKAVYVERAAGHGAASVHGDNGEELLAITYLNPQVLRLRGEFACKGHAPVRIEDAKPIPGVPAASCLDGRGVSVP